MNKCVQTWQGEVSYNVEHLSQVTDDLHKRFCYLSKHSDLSYMVKIDQNIAIFVIRSAVSDIQPIWTFRDKLALISMVWNFEGWFLNIQGSFLEK